MEGGCVSNQANLTLGGMEGSLAWMGRHGWQRGVPPPSHHPMTGYHHATRPASEDDTWCDMKALQCHITLCHTRLYQSNTTMRPRKQTASEDDTWCGMKAYGRRGRTTVRSSDHSLAITCPNLPLPPTTGYFVKPTIPFDRISSRPCTAQCRQIYMEPSGKPTKCVLYTPEGLTAYKGYMAPMFAGIQFFSSDSTVRK